MSLAIKSVLWLGIHKSYNFFQSFKVSVVRHVHSDLKQQVSYIPKYEISYKMVFCVWLGMNKYIYMIKSIHLSVAKSTWA